MKKANSGKKGQTVKDPAKLEMVATPAGKTAFQAESEKLSANSLAVAISSPKEEIPQNLERVTLPPLLKCGDGPTDFRIGMTCSGVLVGLAENFTGKRELRNARMLHLRHKSGLEFLLPFSGGVRQVFKKWLKKTGTGEDAQETLSDEIIGDTWFFTRLPDGHTKNYGGKSFFSFDIQRAKKENTK